MVRSTMLGVGLIFLTTCACAQGRTLEVGTGKPYTLPSEAVAEANDGDVIEIDTAGDYIGDVCRITQNDLTLRGVGAGRALLDSKGKVADGKGIWHITGNNITVEKIEFRGARAPDKNGAGIRAAGHNLIVRHCRFHDCEDAILNGAGTIVIEHCEFSYCGLSDKPFHTHNLYLSAKVDKLVYRFNYSHHSAKGHLLKSRAKENYILYNYLTDHQDGTSSYVIDLPNGGLAVIMGNVLRKGPRGLNNVVITYGGEGVTHEHNGLYVVNNTMRNDMKDGWFIRMRNWPHGMPTVIANNVMAGQATKVCNNQKAMMRSNWAGPWPEGLALRPPVIPPMGSAWIDRGDGVEVDNGPELVPRREYVHPLSSRTRPTDRAIDIGAYERTTP